MGRYVVMGPPPFQTFLESHRDDVYRFLVAAVGPSEAEDCFQETFISALRAYPRLRANSNLRAWVLKIAQRKALDCHRSRGRRPAPVSEPGETAAPPRPERDDGLWGLVGELPAKQRAAIVLRFVNDLPHGEIGRVIGCSEDAARRNVYEGLTSLREVWSDEGA